MRANRLGRDHVWRNIAGAGGMALLLSLPAGGAAAQGTAPGVIEIPPVTVTARKREEAEQSVPIGMTVLEGERLEINPTASNAGLLRAAPNAHLVDLGGQAPNFANIRGVGSFSPLAPDDASVVFYVDEAPQSGYGLAPVLLDTERVEILRGPQGTLFGRNTQGGAVSIVSRQPDFAREFAARGEIGSTGYGLGEIIANGPLLTDRLAGRLALRYSSFGGDVPNIVIGGDDGGVDIGAARGTLLFTPDDRTTATLALSHTHSRETTPRFLLRDAADFPASAVDPRGLVDGEASGINLKLRHEFGAVVLDTVTSVQRNTSLQRLDIADGLVFSRLTGLPAAFFNVSGSDVAELDLRQTIYLQELRLSAPRESAVAWTAGVNLFRSELALDRDGRSGLPSFATFNGRQENDLVTDSYSAFGEVTVPVVAALKATLGLRASHEEKTASYRYRGNGTPGIVAAFAQDAGRDEDFVTGRAALSYDWSPGLMTYASVARGHVTGGFPAVTVNNARGRPEAEFPASTSWSYELGFKSKLLDGRLALNGAVFFNDVKNGHLVVFDPANAVFTTATLDYRSHGGEIEAVARLVPGLDLFGGIGYTHAELVGVPAASPTGARSGNDVPNVPALTANVGAQYRLPGEALGVGGAFLGRAAYQHVDARAADVANSFDLRGYGLVNAKLGWEGDSFEVYGFAWNLLDERYEAFGQSFGPAAPTVRVGQGRILGIGAAVRF